MMPIYKNNRVQRVFRGDHKPVRIYRGANKIAGWEEATAAGQNVTADNTYNDAAHVEVQGNTELQSDYMECWGGSAQKTLDGINLLPLTNIKKLSTGTVVVNGDTITFTDFTFGVTFDKDFIPGESYAFSAESIAIKDCNPAYPYGRLRWNDAGTQNYRELTTIISCAQTIITAPSSYSNPRLMWYVDLSDVGYNATITKPQLQLGTAATAYEQYCGGKPSPNPDYPQAITPLVTAGTYKITTDYGIYEVTIPDLHGIGDATDKVVFDALSGKGYLLQQCNYFDFSTAPSVSWVDNNNNSGVGYVAFKFNVNGNNKLRAIVKNGHAEGTYLTENNIGRSYINTVNVATVCETGLGSKEAAFEKYKNNAVVYVLETPIRTPLTFTKVETSTAPELPLHVFEDGTTTPPTSNAPSIDYPQTIVPASGTLTTSCGEQQSTQQIPPLYGIKNTDGTWAARDKLVIDDATKTAWIERNCAVIESYNGETITTAYYSSTGELSTGATIVYALTQSTIEPIDYIAAKTYYPQTVIELTGNLPMDMTTTYKHF